MMDRAIILLSGGLDSATTLGIAMRSGKECFPLTFDYKQRHSKEITSAQEIAYYYMGRGDNNGGLCHPAQVVTIGGLVLPTTALASSLAVPKPGGSGIPVTYVPARNAIFLSIAAAFAEALGADEVWAGYNSIDYSGYPDCRPEFVAAMQKALELGTKTGVEGSPIRLIAPIIHFSKKQIIDEALHIYVPIQLTWSCYRGELKPCNDCDSCDIRAKAFAELGVKDPAL